MSLSAAIVVNNEAEYLDACLTSLRGLVDEIIVIDTGSSDGSVEVARAHGVVVVVGGWQGDYSIARNRSLDLATGDWVLAVNADERLEGDFDAVRSSLDQADAWVAFRVRVVPRVGWTPVRELRLWRNRPDIRFRNQIRETVAPDIEAVADTDRFGVTSFDRLTIRPVGDVGIRSDRRARDEPLLVAELARDPDRPWVYDQLARLYEAAGDVERAVETWKRGITIARRRDQVHVDDRLLYVDLVQHLLAAAVIDDELELLVREARDRWGRLPTPELAAARLAFATGRPRDALEPLDWLVGLDDEAIVATGISYDERVFGEWAWSLLGLCRFALGDDAEAAVRVRARAEQYAPDESSYAVRRRLAEARAGSGSA